MTRTAFVERLFSKSRTLLGVETDGFGLRAAVLTAVRGEVLFEKIVVTREADPDAALAEVLSKLRKDHGVLPKKALLLTATAIPALLNLPVSPGRLRPYPQMQEMARWEMEPFFVQRVGVWKLGAVFVRRGYLRSDQLEEALQEIVRRPLGNAGAESDVLNAPRLGDWAVARGFLTPAQRDECLAIQIGLQTADDEIVCGWSAQSSGPSSRGAARMGQQSSWLVCGMGRADRLRWVTRFEGQGLSLQGIYPLVGCATAALNDDLTSSTGPASRTGRAGRTGTGVVIETRSGMMSCVRLEKGRLSSLQVRYANPDDPIPMSEQARQEEGAIYLAEEGQAVPTSPAISSMRQKQEARPIVVTLAPTARLPEGMNASTLSGMLGAARHRWGFEGGERTPCVPAQDPGPPLWQRPQAWWAGACILTLLGIGVMEGTLAFQRNTLGRRHADVLRTLSEREKTDQALLDLQREVASLQTRLGERRNVLQSLSERKRQISIRGTGRAEGVASLLDRMTVALPDAVTLTRVADTQQGIQVEANALSEEALARFPLRLSEAVTPLGIKIHHLENAMQTSEVAPSETGYRMTLRLIPIPSKTPPPPQETPPEEERSLAQKMLGGLRGLVGGSREGTDKEVNR